MGKLSNILLGTPEQRARAKKRKEELKIAEKEAYYKGYREAKVKAARRRGRKAGKGGTGLGAKLGRAGPYLEGTKTGAESYIGEVFGDFGLGLRSSTKRKAKRKKKKVYIE